MRKLQNKRHRRRAVAARSAWLRFQGRHDPGGPLALEECGLCDGRASRCYCCNGVGVVIFGWLDEDGKPSRGVHTDSRQVQDANGDRCEGAFAGWDGRRRTVPRCSE